MTDDGLERHDPVAYLADDFIVEILSQLPAKQLCRLKCVSRSWRDLISGPVHRLRLARTDAASGFLYHHIRRGAPTGLKFTALCPPVGRGGSPAAPPLVDPAFPFLPSRYTRTRMRLLDSCNGLLLLRCVTDDDPPLAAPRYVVCNPGARSWVDLSTSPPVHHHQNHAPGQHAGPGVDAAVIDAADGLMLLRNRMDWARPAVLAFDPEVSSSHFHVMELVGGNSLLTAVRIYSSQTGQWVLRNTEWRHVDYAGKHVYLNGFLHLATATAAASGVVVASVDAAGQTWRTTRVCAAKTIGGPGAIGQSQGRLLYVDVDVDAAGSGELSVYALESCGGVDVERWVLKHRAMSALDPSGKEVWFGKRHRMVAVHPDCAVIFLFDSRRRSLIAYDMDHGTTRAVHTFTNSSSYKYRFFPYVASNSQ